jgi:putative GTP pyrophosphokinase
MANINEVTDYCMRRYSEIDHELSLFRDQVQGWFSTHPKLSKCKPSVVHSVKSRLKEKSHLQEKVIRKLSIEPAVINHELDSGWNEESVFESLTDLAGVRVLLLHQTQFSVVHTELQKKFTSGDWTLYEPPKAYTWDPDSASYFESLGITTKIKESHYTSVHYVIRPRPESPLTCEIQVRTLFEEIWGEVDHTLNYPNPTQSIACREQLRVLAKLVGAGSRLVDSIFNSSEVPATPERFEPDAPVERPFLPVFMPPTEKPAPEDIPEENPDLPEVNNEVSSYSSPLY